jgi:hypothetical protein
MKLIAVDRIRLSADFTAEVGAEFDPADHALPARDVAELLAIGAATEVAEPEPAPAAPTKTARK